MTNVSIMTALPGYSVILPQEEGEPHLIPVIGWAVTTYHDDMDEMTSWTIEPICVSNIYGNNVWVQGPKGEVYEVGGETRFDTLKQYLEHKRVSEVVE